MADGIAVVMKVPRVERYQPGEESTGDRTGGRKSGWKRSHLSTSILPSSPPYFLSTYHLPLYHHHHHQLQLAWTPPGFRCIKRPVVSFSSRRLVRQNPLILQVDIFVMFGWWFIYNDGSIVQASGWDSAESLLDDLTQERKKVPCPPMQREFKFFTFSAEMAFDVKSPGSKVNGKTDKLSYVISSVTVVAVIAKVTAEIWEHGDISTMKLNKTRDSILSLTFSLPLFVGVYLQPVWMFF